MNLTDRSRAKLERIFSSAVALDQSGLLRNTIYCYGNTIFILSGDNTVLLRFVTNPKEVPPFKNQVSFKANDYESGDFYEESGLVIFKATGRKDDEFTRSKSCKAPGLIFSEVESIWNKFDFTPHSTFLISKNTLPMIDDGLSHLEIQSKAKSLVIIQRDIFSGTTITLNRKKASGLGAHKPDEITNDFGPIGIRTNDFLSLFSFYDLIEFGVTSKPGFITAKSGEMSGIIAWCIYDELGTVEVIKYGRQEQEDRRSEQSTDRPVAIRQATPRPPQA